MLTAAGCALDCLQIAYDQWAKSVGLPAVHYRSIARRAIRAAPSLSARSSYSPEPPLAVCPPKRTLQGVFRDRGHDRGRPARHRLVR